MTLKGVLRIEHSQDGDSARMRVIFFAEPADGNQVPKSVADSESVEARWVTLEEFENFGK